MNINKMFRLKCYKKKWKSYMEDIGFHAFTGILMSTNEIWKQRRCQRKYWYSFNLGSIIYLTYVVKSFVINKNCDSIFKFLKYRLLQTIWLHKLSYAKKYCQRNLTSKLFRNYLEQSIAFQVIILVQKMWLALGQLQRGLR